VEHHLHAFDIDEFIFHDRRSLVGHLFVGEGRASATSACSSSKPTTPMTTMAMMMCGTFRLFHSSQTQKPMPTPPVSISAATITSQAVPIDRRTPVSM
jgi:hypothetical protein